MLNKVIRKNKYNNTNSQYRPWFHINTNQGKINNITSIYKKSGWYYVLFDHELNFNRTHPYHCLSLATSKDFYNFQYHYEVIKPDSDVDKGGIISASFVNHFKSQYFIYLGINDDTKTIIRASTNSIDFKIQNKNKIIDSKEFLKQYNSTIDAITIFRGYWNNKYLLVTGSNKANNPIVFIFKLDRFLRSIKLVKRIIIKSQTGKIISPSVIFANQRVYLFYTNVNNINNKLEYRSYYAILTYHEMFQKADTIIELFSEIDYSNIFGGIQTYKRFNKIYLLGCLNDNKFFNLKETKNGWANVIGSVRNLQVSKFSISTKVDLKIRDAILNNSYPLTAYANIFVKNNSKILIGDETKTWIEINVLNNHCSITNRIFKKTSITDIIDTNNVETIEILIDVSLVEININKSKWYSTRCYFGNEVIIRQV